VQIAVLVVTGALMALGSRTRSVADGQTVRSGAALGAILGIIWILEESYNLIWTAPIPQRDLVDNLLWGLIALAIFVAAVLRAVGSGQVLPGVQAGLWSGTVSGVIACLMAEIFVVFFIHLVIQDPASRQEWAVQGASSSAPNIETYWAYASLKGALLLHLLLTGPIMGGLLGVLGGVIGQGAATLRRPAD
jgi:hypothetical protein